MEKFAVDLDKVLDEFELNEDKAEELTAGRETKPSGFQEFLKANGDAVYTFSDNCVPLSQGCPPSLDRSTKPQDVSSINVRYDFPYEPAESIDLADADFAPSARTSSGVPSRAFVNDVQVAEANNGVLGSESSSLSCTVTTIGSTSASVNGHTETCIVSSVPQQPVVTTRENSVPYLPAGCDTAPAKPLQVAPFSSFTLFGQNKTTNSIANTALSDTDNKECSADKLMNDIEVAMGTGLPLSKFHCDGQQDQAPTVADCEETEASSDLTATVVSGEVSAIHSSEDTTLKHEVNLETVDISASLNDSANVPSVKLSDTTSNNYLVDCQQTVQSRLSIKNDLGNKKQDNVPEGFSQAGDLLHSATSDSLLNTCDIGLTSSSLTLANECSTSLSDGIPNETSTPVVEVLGDIASEATVCDTGPASPDDHSSIHTQSDYATPVGFSIDVTVTDNELDKYLQEADSDNRKLEGREYEERLDVAGECHEAEVDGFSSGEDYYTPMIERPSSQAELSNMDPFLASNLDEIKPDQVYEDIQVERDSVDSLKTSRKTNELVIQPIGELELDIGIHRERRSKRRKDVEKNSGLPSTNMGARPKVTNLDQDEVEEQANSASNVSSENPTEQLTEQNGTDYPLDETVSCSGGESEETEPWTDRRVIHDAINRERAQKKKITDTHIVKEKQNLEIKNQLQSGTYKTSDLETSSSVSAVDLALTDSSDFTQETPDLETVSQSDVCDASVANSEYPTQYWSSKAQRPTSLNLPDKIALSPSEGIEAVEGGIEPRDDDASPSVECSELPTPVPDESMTIEASEESVWEGAEPGSTPMAATPTWAEEEMQLGKVAPFWIPDADAPTCMQCSSKFTVIKRRHHCRACGRVLCSQCCSMKARLPYMDNREARVCQQCLMSLSKVPAADHWPQSTCSPASSSPGTPLSTPVSPLPSPLTPLNRSPNPNNPNEYCSTIPPLQQAQANLNAPPPTVMVPVGVLKRQGSKSRGEPKQVMFSDGIRPGGDLTELDNPVEPKPPFRRAARAQKKIEKSSDSVVQNPRPRSPPSRLRGIRLPDLPPQVFHFIPEDDGRVPPIISPSSDFGEYSINDNPNPEELYATLKDPQVAPVIFAVNKNLFVSVKIVTLDCCLSRICWCFTTRGMCTVGQEELVFLLECQPDEKLVPKDIFYHCSTVYEEASQGNPITDLGHTIFTQSFLGSREHGGFLYVRPTFQCLNQLILPSPPFLVGILLQKWETPWAKVFPIRLMLRLGAEFRYYPCPLLSVRFRKPVYCEIGHTIMNLLADFRNYQYKLPIVRGLVVHMQDKKTYINFPRNRYDEAMKALNNSNDHVLALSGNFSLEADSHLVCIQNDEGNYQTQAINIQSKPRIVTGASFVVFNGALKSSSGLTAKSSIVEDGLMVQIPPDTMVALQQALRDMQDFTIGCGPLRAEQPDEEVRIQWVDDDKNVNIGVKSTIDGMAMDGISSIYIHGGTDYMGENYLIRWTEVFLIQCDDSSSSRRSEPVNISRLSEILAQACCIALTAHLDSLKEAGLTKIGLRVTIDAENVGYEAGSCGSKLPTLYMNDLDSELVPVIHRAASQSQEAPTTLELVFHIMEQ